MLSLSGFLSQSTPSLTISETDSLYMAVTTLHRELKMYAPEPCGPFDSIARDIKVVPLAENISTTEQCESNQ